jgi:hypothetical protein
MLPIWRAILPAIALAGLGAAIDRLMRLGLGGGPGRWPRWIACGLAACFAAALHPVVLVLLLAVALAWRVHDSTGAHVVKTWSPPWRWLQGVAVLALAAIALRPATPMYWDAFVWLGKARIESGGLGALRTGALDPSADVIPAGYPLLWPLAASWFSSFGRTAAALTAGAAATTLLSLLLFLDAAAAAFDGRDPSLGAAERRPRWALGAGLAILGVTPLLFVHLRSAYADLPVGLMAATCTLRLGRDLEARDEASGDIACAAIVALVLSGLKDEGVAHVAAIVLSLIATRELCGRRASLRSPAVVLGAAALPFMAWRILLVAHGLANGDHELSTPDLAALGKIATVTLSSMGDMKSWGALWSLATVSAVIVLVRRSSFRPATVLAAIAVLGEGAMLGGALLFGPDRVRAFAFEGTLVNRLLVQLAPPAGALFMLALGDSAARGRASTDGRSS